MPRKYNLTDEGRKRKVSNLTEAGKRKGRRNAAAKTNALIAERKQQRLARVRELHQQGKTPAEMANLLDVSQRTIKRDLKELENGA